MEKSFSLCSLPLDNDIRLQLNALVSVVVRLGHSTATATVNALTLALQSIIE